MEAIRESIGDMEWLRADFPILRVRRNGWPLVYLDNAATTQKPLRVLHALDHYYRAQNANVHRGVHYLSEIATEQYEEARVKIQRFFGIAKPTEVIFTRGATEAINLVANSYGRKVVGEGDEILISTMEHHSNIVPWQMLCEERGARLRVIPITDAGELRMDEFDSMLTERTRLVAVTYVSNALGTVNPVRDIVARAHRASVPVLIDGAQAAPHIAVDMGELGCDFFVCSGHKMYGPTGIGILYGREELLDSMPPWQGGGDMILSVSFEKTVYNELPMKFEAGTPNIEGAIGLGAAIEYLERLGMNNIAEHEADLLKCATEMLEDLGGVRIVGTATHKAGVISFVMNAAHPHDIAQVLDDTGVAIRAGHHCAQPVLHRMGLAATARASFGLYNTREEVDALAHALMRVKEIFE
jgi:cysteine desulfurase/selenocysteine lyase